MSQPDEEQQDVPDINEKLLLDLAWERQQKKVSASYRCQGEAEIRAKLIAC